VASTSTEKSLRIFNGRTRYNEWVFLPGQPRVVGRPVGPAMPRPGGAFPGARPPAGGPTTRPEPTASRRAAGVAAGPPPAGVCPSPWGPRARRAEGAGKAAAAARRETRGSRATAASGSSRRPGARRSGLGPQGSRPGPAPSGRRKDR
jgi:hypothetical protein